jgi:hypothetical protein
MAGFNPAWFIAAAIGVALLAIDILIPEERRKKIGWMLLSFAAVLLIVGFIGLGFDAYTKFSKKAQPTEAKKSGAQPRQTPQAEPEQHLRKPDIIRSLAFSTLIPIDGAPQHFPIPYDENVGDPKAKVYVRLGGEFSGAMVNGYAWPQTMAEQSAFLGRLLQYDIFQFVNMLHQDYVSSTLGVGAEAHAGIPVPDSCPYPSGALLQELASNPFFPRTEVEMEIFRRNLVRMPKGAHIILREAREKYIVRITRPKFFLLEFAVHPMPMGAGTTPKNFISKEWKTITSFAFAINLNYEIRDTTDPSFQPQSYVSWADTILDSLRKDLASD